MMKALLTAICALLGGVAASSIFSGSAVAWDASSQAEVRAIGAAQTDIAAKLRDPDSVQWINAVGWKVVNFGGPHSSVPGLVCAQFRAKNGFGGYSDELAIVYLIISVDWNNAAVHFNPLRKEWTRMCIEPHPSVESAAKELAVEFAAMGLKP